MRRTGFILVQVSCARLIKAAGSALFPLISDDFSHDGRGGEGGLTPPSRSDVTLDIVSISQLFKNISAQMTD